MQSENHLRSTSPGSSVHRSHSLRKDMKFFRPPSMANNSHSGVSLESSASSTSSHQEAFKNLVQVKHSILSPASTNYLPPMSDVWLDGDSDDESMHHKHKNSAPSFPNLKRLTRKEHGSSVRVDHVDTDILDSSTKVRNYSGSVDHCTSQHFKGSRSFQKKKRHSIDQTVSINREEHHKHSSSITSTGSSSSSIAISASSRLLRFLSPTRSSSQFASLSPTSSASNSSVIKAKISFPTNFVHQNHLDQSSTAADVLGIATLGKGGLNGIPSAAGNAPLSTRRTSSLRTRPNKNTPLPAVAPISPPRPARPRARDLDFSTPNLHSSYRPSVLDHWRQNSSSSSYSTGSSTGLHYSSVTTVSSNPSTTCSSPSEVNFNNSPVSWKLLHHEGSVPGAVNKQVSNDSFGSWSTANADFMEQQRWLMHNVSDTDTGNNASCTSLADNMSHASSSGNEKVSPRYQSGDYAVEDMRCDGRRSMLLPSPQLNSKSSYEKYVPTASSGLGAYMTPSRSDLHDVQEEDQIPMGGWI